MFLVKSHGVVMFSEIYGVLVYNVTKCVSVLMIQIWKNLVKVIWWSVWAGFLCGVLCISAFG